MDRCRNRNKSWDSVEEDGYDDLAEDRMEMLNVNILPAIPINDNNRDYADRDFPRLSAQNLSSLAALQQGSSSIVLRKSPRLPAPAINRDLKPGRRTGLDGRSTPAQPGYQFTSSRRSPSPSPLTAELDNQFTRLTLREPCMRNGQRTNTKAGSSPHSKGLPRGDSFTAEFHNKRHSLDLETHDIEKRLQHCLERTSSKSNHHEWPQTKDDCEQVYFVPLEKPEQSVFEDWYVGDCSRSDAEHALHLVNKDGAFLVRDRSVNSDSEPLVLVVYHGKRVFNIKIRFVEGVNKFSLYRKKEMFETVADIIKFHSIFPIILSRRLMALGRYPNNCVLTCPVTRQEMEQLLQ